MFFSRLRLLLVLAVVPSISTAETIVVVGTGSCEAPGLSGHVRAVREALLKRNRSAVRSEEETLRRLGGLRQSSLPVAKRLLSEAERELESDVPISQAESLQREHRALQKVNEARSELAGVTPSVERSQVMVTAKLLEINLFSGAGREAELQRSLEAIFQVLPRFAFDRRVYSPPQLEAFEAVRKRVQGQSNAVIKVRSSPAGATVHVNGFEIGKAPIALRVPPGTYRIESVRGMRRGIVREIALDKNGRIEIELERDLDDSLQIEKGPCVAGSTSNDRVGKLRRFADLLGVDTVVAVREDRTDGGEVVVETVPRGKRKGTSVSLTQRAFDPAGLERLWEDLALSK